MVLTMRVFSTQEESHKRCYEAASLEVSDPGCLETDLQWGLTDTIFIPLLGKLWPFFFLYGIAIQTHWLTPLNCSKRMKP